MKAGPLPVRALSDHATVVGLALDYRFLAAVCIALSCGVIISSASPALGSQMPSVQFAAGAFATLFSKSHQ